MTKAEIVSEIAKRTGIKRAVATNCVESFLDVVKDALSNGANVYIRGFGSFLIRYRAEKVARDISNNASITIPAHNTPVFKPSDELKKLVD